MDAGNTKECPNSPNGLHCWHGRFNGYSTGGNDQTEVCCHCGMTRKLHGPFAPNNGYPYRFGPMYTLECYNGRGY